MACHGGGISLHALEISFQRGICLFLEAYLMVGKTEIEKKTCIYHQFSLEQSAICRFY